MILTGKCADRFKEWLPKRYRAILLAIEDILEDHLEESTELQYSIFIEFFDSEGMYISPFYSSGRWIYAASWEVKRDLKKPSFPSRTEALKAAIEKAGLIFNER